MKKNLSMTSPVIRSNSALLSRSKSKSPSFDIQSRHGSSKYSIKTGSLKDYDSVYNKKMLLLKQTKEIGIHKLREMCSLLE